MTERRSVVFGHGYALIREGVKRVLTEYGFDVVAEAATVGDLEEAVKLYNPAVILVDKEMLNADREAVFALATADDGGKVAVLAKPEPQDDIQAMLQAGIRGYLSANLEPEEFNRSLMLLANGDIVVSSHLAADLSREIAEDAGEVSAAALSDRELDVLGLVGRGKTNREIAHELLITESTVKAHVRNVFDKLNLRNRQQAAAYAAREGLVTEEAEPDEQEAQA